MSMLAADGGALTPESLTAEFEDAAQAEIEAAAQEAAAEALPLNENAQATAPEAGGVDSPASGDGLPPERISELNALHSWMEANPEQAMALLQARTAPAVAEPERAAPVVSPQPVAAEPPPDLDLEDPAIRYLYDRLQRQEQALLRVGQQSQEQIVRGHMSSVDQGLARFSQEHPDLSAEDIMAIRQSPATQNIFAAYAQQNPNDIAGAAHRAFNDGMWTVPTVRQAQLDKVAAPAVTELDRARQNRWSGVQGGQGGTRPLAPMTKQERDQGMHEAIRQAMTGSAV
jgi:hypothetical protein